MDERAAGSGSTGPRLALAAGLVVVVAIVAFKVLSAGRPSGYPQEDEAGIGGVPWGAPAEEHGLIAAEGAAGTMTASAIRFHGLDRPVRGLQTWIREDEAVWGLAPRRVNFLVLEGKVVGALLLGVSPDEVAAIKARFGPAHFHETRAIESWHWYGKVVDVELRENLLLVTHAPTFARLKEAQGEK